MTAPGIVVAIYPRGYPQRPMVVYRCETADVRDGFLCLGRAYEERGNPNEPRTLYFPGSSMSFAERIEL